MSWSDANDAGWDELDDDTGEPGPPRWPLAPTGALLPRERWLWFEQLWTDVCKLRDRYRGHLPIRTGWWENQLQVEALAAPAAWVGRDKPVAASSCRWDAER